MKLDKQAPPLHRVKDRVTTRLITMDVMLKDHEIREELLKESAFVLERDFKPPS